jgi:hypothetical protein
LPRGWWRAPSPRAWGQDEQSSLCLTAAPSCLDSLFSIVMT